MRKAFTLIELLVVIAIIAILAAILFPVFAQAKEAAKASQVLSELQQVGTAVQLYATDYDDSIVPWLTRTNSPNRNFYRDDRLTWVQNVQPYTKNGNPTIDRTKYSTYASMAGAEIPPVGMMNSPVWVKQRWLDDSDAADCDGNGAPGSGLKSAGYGVIDWFHAHYGIGFGVKAAVNNDYSNDYKTTCTNASPWFWFAGSDPFGCAPAGVGVTCNGPATGPGAFYRNNSTGYVVSAGLVYANLNMTLSQVNRPAETSIVTDGFTGMIDNPGGTFPGVGTTSGCESSNMYKGGGNVAFLDSHAKFVKGNSERYLDKDSGGCVYKRYYSIDK